MNPRFEKLKRQKGISFILLLATLALGIVIGSIVNTGVQAQKQTSAAAPDATPLTIPPAAPIANEFSKLTKRVEPSVVYIESDYLPKPGASKKTRKADPEDEDDSDSSGSTDSPKKQDPSDMFRRFFGNSEPQHSFRSEGSGTGFVVDKNGYLLTNYHVVENADRIKVKVTGDDVEYRGHVVGFDKETDLAVLKVDVKHALQPVQIGNSEGVQVGDWVIAIGSPFGLQATVTAGIVSAQRNNHDLPGATSFQNFLQTDAAINPGNSGGPLLNIRGEVIGVNTMIATRNGSYEGVGFALPSNMAVKVYNDIIRNGRVVRGSIGIRWKTNASQMDTLQAFGLDHGVMIDEVAAAGPAGKAGIKSDDIIVALNDKPVKDGNELVTRVADMPIGSTVGIAVDRNGQKMDFKVQIGERSVVWQGEPQVTESAPKEPVLPTSNKTPDPAKFGITIQRLTDKERQDLAISDKTGVKVVSVDPGSFADDIGMQEGDTILSINRVPMLGPDDVSRVQNGFHAGQPIAVHVARALQGGRRVQPQRFYLSGRLPTD